jgi:hypothetical protein
MTPTSDATQIGINPCVYYVPSAATTISSSCTDPTATNFGASAACTYTSTTCSTLDQISGNCPTTTPSTGGDTLTASPSNGAPPLTVTFSGSVVDATYALDFGDGSTPLNGSTLDSTTATVVSGTHSYTGPGTYTATVTSPSGSATAVVTVGTAVVTTNPTSTPTSIFINVGSTSTTTLGQVQFSAIPGVTGNVVFGSDGATAYATESSGNTEVSGFYGSDTFGGQPQNIFAQICQSRPWAGNFLANIIPPSFFDGLCQWQGFQVGAPQQVTQSQVVLEQGAVQQQSAPQQKAPTQTTPSAAAPSGPSQVQIWAVPNAVPLGGRTSVFWNTQGVTNCTETSPDGSFSQNSLSGAAATVPLTAATTFSISCLNASSTPVTDYTTVTISI